jgi:hypothetical protein
MTVTIELPPEVESSLVAQAEAWGLPLAQYVEYLVEYILREQVPLHADAALSPDERAAVWRESVKGLPNTPPLSDEAISRESIYGDRS